VTTRNLAYATLTSLVVLFASAAEAQPLGETVAPPAAAPRPLVLLLDGLGVYVENDYVGVSALARPLQRQGFRTLTDSHLMTRTNGVVPDIIIGHSMGGETALRYAAKLSAAGTPAPLVITIDAAPAPPPCRVPRCINIHGPGFANVSGAINIDAWAQGARFTSHAQLPTAAAVRALILDETQAFLGERQAPADPAVTSVEPVPAPPVTPAPGSTQMWSVPGWTLPDARLPGLWRNGG